MSQRYIGGLIYNPPGGFSGYFDGSGDYIQAGTNANLALGSGNFTIEGWHYCAGYNGGGTLYSTINTYPSSTGLLFYIDSIGRYTIDVNGTILQPAGTAVLNAWIHWAVVRNGSTLSIYINGTSIGSVSSSTNFTDQYAVIGRTGAGTNSNLFLGYLSNTRMVKGTAVYTANFTPPVGQLQAITNTQLLTCAYPTFRDGSSNNFTITVNGNTAVSTQNPFPLTQLPNPALGNQGNGVYSMSQYQALRSQNLWPAIDPYFDFVTLMLHGNGTNGAQNNTFLDSSTNNFTITRNGNTTQGTFTPYGANWSNYFDGSGDWLTAGAASNWQFLNSGASDYTIEAWVFLPSVSAQQFICATNAAGAAVGVNFQVTSSATLTLEFTRGVGGSFATFTSTGTLSANTWNHVAVTFATSGKTASFYINGTAAGSSSNTGYSYSASNPSNTLNIGREPSGSGLLTGYISNLRIVSSLVYTSNFTPSTSPLTAITNTSLLTCQSNRFIDNSSNNFTITRNGDVSVQRFSPFAPTTPYAAGTIGGSGYFDGSGDYLNGPTTGQFAPTGDFTISMWFYPTSFAASYYVLAGSWNAGASDEWLIQYDNTGAIRFLTTTDSTFSAAGVVKLNQWQFLSISRSGSTVTGYINGTSFRSYTLTGTVGSATKTVYVGIQAGTTWPYVGYISDYRLVAGSAQSATPPTSPATAISGTNTLLNFTNGGIIDNAMMNDLETVGNAQISTSVSKFGGGSIYLDGTDDRLTAINRENFNFGTGDFTVEFWINASASGSFTQVVGTLVTGTEAGTWRVGNRFNSTNAVYFARGNGTGFDEFNAAVNVNDGAWHHVAVTRASGTVRIFVDGTLGASSSITGTCSSSNPLTIGYNQRDNTYVTGYIDDLRLTKGYARYTANFTPQRSQWQDQ